MSEVFEATSFSIWAPMSSYGSFSSISLATVTPSFVIVGLPNFLSMTTLRPFGPSVAFTASAMDVDAPEQRRPGVLGELELLWHRSRPSLLENGEDVFLAHDQVLLVIELDLGAGVLPEQNLVPGLHVERDLLALVGDLAVADGDHLGLLRLLLGRVRDDDPALLDLFLLEPLHHKPIVQRTNLHGLSPSFGSLRISTSLGQRLPTGLR